MIWSIFFIHLYSWLFTEVFPFHHLSQGCSSSSRPEAQTHDLPVGVTGDNPPSLPTGYDGHTCRGTAPIAWELIFPIYCIIATIPGHSPRWRHRITLSLSPRLLHQCGANVFCLREAKPLDRACNFTLGEASGFIISNTVQCFNSGRTITSHPYPASQICWVIFTTADPRIIKTCSWMNSST